MFLMNYDKISGLIYTEKSNKQIADNKYCFKVVRDCNKKEVKLLVKNVFNVDAEKINILNVNGKTKRFKGIIGNRKSYKKAIVTLKKGQSINLQNLKIKDGN